MRFILKPYSGKTKEGDNHHRKPWASFDEGGHQSRRASVRVCPWSSRHLDGTHMWWYRGWSSRLVRLNNNDYYLVLCLSFLPASSSSLSPSVGWFGCNCLLGNLNLSLASLVRWLWMCFCIYLPLFLSCLDMQAGLYEGRVRLWPCNVHWLKRNKPTP